VGRGRAAPSALLALGPQPSLLVLERKEKHSQITAGASPECTVWIRFSLVSSLLRIVGGGFRSIQGVEATADFRLASDGEG
jgi:hypothetical protein